MTSAYDKDKMKLASIDMRQAAPFETRRGKPRENSGHL